MSSETEVITDSETSLMTKDSDTMSHTMIPPRPSTTTTAAAAVAVAADNMGGHITPATAAVRSVYLAAGIHHHVTSEDFDVLPRRFQAGSAKARISWFGSLCIAGIGMFVEAYVIITTGQLKTIWHASYPTCWDGMNEQECPDSILCCGLFPNTPIDTTTGECAIMNPTQYDVCDATTGAYDPSMLCSEGILNSISYTEFAGLMIGMMSFGFIGDWMGLKNAVRILVDCLY